MVDNEELDLRGPHVRWFVVGGGALRTLPERPGYTYPRSAQQNLVNVSPSWKDWWWTGRFTTLEVALWLDDADAAPTFSTSRRTFRVELAFDGQFLESQDRRRLADVGATHLRRTMEHVRDELGLGPLPEVPPIPFWPSRIDLDDPDVDPTGSVDQAGLLRPWTSWELLRFGWSG